MWLVLILAIVQGVAEFLPISSSGHLVILGDWFGDLADEPTLEIILHAGTLGSIVVVYYRRIWELLTRDRRVIGLVLAASIPTGIVGLVIKSQFNELTRSPMLASAMLLITGIGLLVLRTYRGGETGYHRLPYLAAVVVGCFQSFAILPGISRSGSTILGGRMMGLKNEDAVTFSFLIAIPAIAGATLLAMKDLIDPNYNAEIPALTLAIGAAVSFLVGIVSLRLLIRFNRTERLHWFAAWCLPFGAASLLWQWLG